MRLGLIANLISFLVITALTGLVYFLLERAGLETPNALVLSIVSLIILVIIFFSYRQRIWLGITNKLATIAMKRFSKKIGLVQVYDNFHDAASDVQCALEEAREARILIQLGEGIIGGDRSLLFETAKKKKGKGFHMRLLYADSDSPQLSQSRANARLSNFTEWQAAISFTEDSIEALLEDGIHIEARRHREPYLWRLFFFDKTLFFVPYLAEKDNSALAPTFKFTITENSELSLYWVFSEYFEHLWKGREAAPNGVERTGTPR